MSKHGKRLQLTTRGNERYVRRTRAASTTTLTKTKKSPTFKMWPDVNADGFEPSQEWATRSPIAGDGYIAERVRRAEHAHAKITGRRAERRRLNSAWKKDVQ